MVVIKKNNAREISSQQCALLLLVGVFFLGCCNSSPKQITLSPALLVVAVLAFAVIWLCFLPVGTSPPFERWLQ